MKAPANELSRALRKAAPVDSQIQMRTVRIAFQMRTTSTNRQRRISPLEPDGEMLRAHVVRISVSPQHQLKAQTMKRSVLLNALCLLATVAVTKSQAGTFDPQVGQPGSLGIPAASPGFVEWASSVVSLNRGPQNISVAGSPPASTGAATNSLGSPVGNPSRVVSLGDGGSITLGFQRPIADGPGADFAVFENGFSSGPTGSAFLELATVAVSSDGVHFFTFPAVSETQTATQVGGFGLLDASNLYNLAGKYISGYGTGFNLGELAVVSPLLNIHDVTAVRVTDVVGSINPLHGTRDSLGNLINDPFPTPGASSGFDLNAIGVLHTVPEPASWILATAAGLGAAALARRRSIDRCRRPAG